MSARTITQRIARIDSRLRYRDEKDYRTTVHPVSQALDASRA